MLTVAGLRILTDCSCMSAAVITSIMELAPAHHPCRSIHIRQHRHTQRLHCFVIYLSYILAPGMSISAAEMLQDCCEVSLTFLIDLLMCREQV